LTSNSVVVLKAIPMEDKTQKVKELELGQDPLPAERALGAQWDKETDQPRPYIEGKIIRLFVYIGEPARMTSQVFGSPIDPAGTAY